MAQKIINIGTSANKGDGDPIRTAMGKINDNFTELYATSGFDGSFSGLTNTPTTLAGYGITDAIQNGDTLTGDVVGSLFADDSTTLVDGINGTISAPALTGALPALDGSQLQNLPETTNFTSTPTFEAGVIEGFEEKTGATGTVAHDLSAKRIFRHSSIAADFTANLTNTGLADGFGTGVSMILVQGATAYIPTAVEIDGTSQTILWLGGSQPTGTADGVDLVQFTVLQSGVSYTVLGQLVPYS